jgi:hypothetical protein
MLGNYFVILMVFLRENYGFTQLEQINIREGEQLTC